jgi:peptide chain release factor 2
MGEPSFWDDAASAAKVSAEHARVTRRLQTYRSVERDVGDLEALVELAAEDDELAAELDTRLVEVEARLFALEEERLFSGHYDAGDALV